jgi:hypothetical protein
VREYIVVFEAGEIEPGTRWKESKCCLSKAFATFANQHGIELGLDGVQMQNVMRNI